MLYVELHEDDPKDLGRLQAGLDQIETALRNCAGIIETSNCAFRIVRSGPEYIASGKESPFIRIAITQGEDIYAIACVIRSRKCNSPVGAYGIDVVTMPIYIPAGKKEGSWYDPTNPLRAATQIKKGGSA